MIPRYELENIDGDKFSIPFTSDYNLRNWTMQDAKDGNVLAIGDEYFLFKNKKNNTSPVVYISHCFCDSAGAFRVTNGRVGGEFLSIENGIKACPATKEQRDILFAKMKEHGYEWDADKKELKKIEQKNLEQLEDKKMRRCISDVVRKYGAEFTSGTVTKETMLAWLEKQGEHKPAIDVPSKELIFSIWDLGNWWKEITKGGIIEEYGTQLEYIQKHWHDSKWADHHLEKQDEMDNNNNNN